MAQTLLDLWRRLTVPNYRYSRWQFSEEGQASQRLHQLMHWKVRNVLHYFRDMNSAEIVRIIQQDTISPRYRYRHFTRPKSDGTLRDLYEPDEKLKQVQRQILERLLKPAPLHTAVMAYRPKKSTADHAAAHAGSQTIITADVEDFFPQTRAHRVEAWWRGYLEVFATDRYTNTEEYDFDIPARLMTLLTTYKGSLPQGAPTSPALSNLVNFEMDNALERRVQIFGGRYTRYCDDLAFSWRLGEPPSDFEPAVRGVLAEYGYQLHRWNVWDSHDEPEITGIVLRGNGRLDLPDDVKKKMRRLEHSPNSGDQERLNGYRAYESMVKKRR